MFIEHTRMIHMLIMIFIAVVDIPSIDFLSSLQHNKIFEDYLKESQSQAERGDLVLHFTPSVVMATLDYKMFIDSFPNSTQHIVINDQNK